MTPLSIHIISLYFRYANRSDKPHLNLFSVTWFARREDDSMTTINCLVFIRLAYSQTYI